jgi:hypothetical protein
MTMIALTTNKIQYSPFLPIGKTVIAIKKSFHSHLATIISSTANHPYIKGVIMVMLWFITLSNGNIAIYIYFLWLFF